MAPMYGLATRWLLVFGALLVAGCSSPAGPAQPETATPWVEKPGWATRTTAVAAANPLATEAGLQILRAGGSALDAAIAIQMVLTLVEPQSSGIGGGAFLLHFDGRRTQAFDGRETAPAAATPTLLLGADGKPLPFKAAVVGGRSVGAPGTVAMLALAHREHGRLPWKRLFEPAILLAMRGFPVSVRMAAMLASEQDLRKDPVAAAYFYTPQGQPWPVGHLLRNPELAAVLQRIATEGSRCPDNRRMGPGHRQHGAPAPPQPRHTLAGRPRGLSPPGARTPVF
jgi:gamma-glutamyltranspeptidase/glutathione hydrolase